jgi:enoyl-[acyl-carrier-protein] reductase (NADH)
MLDNTKKNLVTGITRVKWIATFLAERTRAETAIAKLVYEKSKLENKMDDLYRDIGRRVLELKEKGEHDVFNDFTIQHALSELKDMKEIVSNYKTQADNINKLPE